MTVSMRPCPECQSPSFYAIVGHKAGPNVWYCTDGHVFKKAPQTAGRVTLEQLRTSLSFEGTSGDRG